MLLNKHFFIFLLFFLLVFSGIAQPREPEYTFPIKPGRVNSLAGTMGELRTTHFHTGLDIKTDGVVGLPVHSAREGYISRIRVGGTGYGLALYVKHPDGNTTVYAHLDHFTESLDSLVLHEQYKRKTFDLNLYFKRDEIKVDKGEVIAYGGNSGSSSGPHLHWDVRDPHQRPINPLKYGFEEIRDTTPPIITKIGFRPMTADSRVNGLFKREEMPVYYSGGKYVLSRNVTLQGDIGIEILAYDKLNDSYNLCGVNYFTTKVNDEEHFSFKIEHLSFAKQRSIYRFYNYRNKLLKGNRFHTLYVDDGNNLNFYPETGNGLIRFAEDDQKKVEILLTDTYGNQSTLTFKNKKGVKGNLYTTTPEYFLSNNLLVVNDKYRDPYEEMTLVFKDEKESISPVVEVTGSQFIYDLNNGLPHLGIIGEDTLSFYFKQKVLPYINYSYFSEEVDIIFRSNSIFDTLYLQHHRYLDPANNREIFSIGNPEIPMNRGIEITLKPTTSYDEKTWSVYYLDDNGGLYYQDTEWENNKATFSTSGFGQYVFEKDIQGPIISPLSLRKNKVRFKITDNLSGIDKIEARIDGEWLLMHYDPKYSLIWSERLDKSKTLDGDFVLEITDNQGNKTSFNHTF